MAFAAFSTGTTAPEAAPRRKSPVALLLLLPGILYLVLFFLAPLVSLLLTSFQAPSGFGDVGQYGYAFRWENYVEVITAYWPHIMRSFGYALIATVLALVFSYPLAYFIGVKARKWPLLQSLMLVLVIAPFFISFLLRTLAWKQLLSDESFVITSLKALSLMAPDAHFTGTPFAVIFGLTYNFIPFMTLPLYTTLERLDLRYLEAGSDLYAHPFDVFRKITIPLSMAASWPARC
jgi:spermidine/putrescine transport system permease protein